MSEEVNQVNDEFEETNEQPKVEETNESFDFSRNMGPATLMPTFEDLHNDGKKLNSICLSFDLETPNKHGAGIFSIAIVPFSMDTYEVYEKSIFYARMDFAEVLNNSKNVGDTISWWMQQSDAARYEVIGKELPKIVNGRKVTNNLPALPYVDGVAYAFGYIQAIQSMLNTNGSLSVMGNGSIFDIGKFETTCFDLGIVADNEDFPYNFWDIVDLRTLLLSVRIAKGRNIKNELKRKGVHHNAVDDARFQAELAVAAVKALEGKDDGKPKQ